MKIIQLQPGLTSYTFIYFDYWYNWSYPKNYITQYYCNSDRKGYPIRRTQYGFIRCMTQYDIGKYKTKTTISRHWPKCRSPIEQLKGFNKRYHDIDDDD